MYVGNVVTITDTVTGVTEVCEIASLSRRRLQDVDGDDSDSWGRQLAAGTVGLTKGTRNAYVAGSPVVVTYVSTPAMHAFLGSDPVAHYGSTNVKFWLPNFKLVSLLETSHIHLLGATFPGPTEDLQWFERFVITTPQSSRIVQVTIKKDIALNRTVKTPALTQLDVTLEDAPSPLEAIKPIHVGKGGHEMWKDYSTPDGVVQFRIGRQLHSPPRHYSKAFEYVYVQTPDLVFNIAPAHAAVEFRKEWFQNERRSAYQYAHLDIHFIHQEGERHFGGILPELWGVRPMSDRVHAMTLGPVEDDEESNATAVCEVGCLLPQGPASVAIQ